MFNVAQRIPEKRNSVLINRRGTCDWVRKERICESRELLAFDIVGAMLYEQTKTGLANRKSDILCDFEIEINQPKSTRT